jgi:coenzyme F420 biosynthesis associated uncharacterized protein
VTRTTSRIGLGIVIGGLLAMGATVAQREILRRAGTRLIDWEAVRGIARRRLGPLAAAPGSRERERAEAFYRDALARIEPLVEAEIGRPLPVALERPAVIGRGEWVDLNLETFRALFGRVEEILIDQQRSSPSTAHALARIANRTVSNQQLGLLLSFLARKVLGQYDVSLLAAGPVPRGRLHFVEPNIVATATGMRVSVDEFRTFIALHEATHAFEFEAHPWLRDHFAAAVARSVEELALDAGGLGQRLREAFRARSSGHWLERLMSDRQRATFRETQALMSLLEGYSNHVMNAVGERILPGFTELHDRFERRNERRGTLESLVLKVTGLDLKMEQYAAGERFVDAVISERGAPFLGRVWDGPEALPTLDEIREPRSWIERIEGRASGTGAVAGTTDEEPKHGA